MNGQKKVVYLFGLLSLCCGNHSDKVLFSVIIECRVDKELVACSIDRLPDCIIPLVLFQAWIDA